MSAAPIKAGWLFIVVLLAGCASPQQIAAEHHAKCRAYGFAKGSSGYSACMMQLDMQRTADNAARRRAAGVAMQNWSNNMAARNQRLQTTCTRIGNVTNCY